MKESDYFENDIGRSKTSSSSSSSSAQDMANNKNNNQLKLNNNKIMGHLGSLALGKNNKVRY